METDQTYWQHRYETADIPWDAGHITTPLKNYFDQLTDKEIRILIPGCGTGHEATYLHQIGFTQVYVCDWAENALQQFQIRTPNFPKKHLICGDFFKMLGQFDLIIEQTFFCAIPPSMRVDYVNQCHALLQRNGRIAGLLFDVDFPKGPPFGGNQEEYNALFAPLFNILQMKFCSNSIKPRQGSELFFEMEKLV